MPNLNNMCIFQGRLTKNPEVKTFGADKKVCKFSIAVNGFKEGDVSFLDMDAWGKTGEFVATLQKGDLIRVLSSIKTDKWKDKEGNAKTKFSFNVESVDAVVRKKKEEVAVTTEQGNNDSIQEENIPF